MEPTSDRFLKRRSLIYYLVVHDAQSGDLVGHLVDITTDGLKLVSTVPIEPGRRLKLRMELPEHYFDQRELCFTAQSRWTSRDINPDFYTTGFTMEEMDETSKDLVSGLVNLYGFND